MSRFRIADEYVSHCEEFARLPTAGGSIPGVSQPGSSLESGSTSSRVPGVSSRRVSQLQEGGLVTGTIDIAHERIHMLSMAREEDKGQEGYGLCLSNPRWWPSLMHPFYQEEYLTSLKIIPPDYREGWALDHDSNTRVLWCFMQPSSGILSNSATHNSL